jgi:hypothetical protein
VDQFRNSKKKIYILVAQRWKYMFLYFINFLFSLRIEISVTYILWRARVLATSEHQIWRARRYWRRRSDCYSSLIYGLTSRHYKFFLQCALTLWRCVSERCWFLCSGSLISFDLVFGDLSLSASALFWSGLLSSTVGRTRRHLLEGFRFPC